MKSYKKIAESLNLSLSDIRAEVLASDLFDRGLESKNIFFQQQGLFSRNYSKDVSDVAVDMIRKAIVFRVARNGLYDILPEGLFHPPTRYSNLNADERKKEFEKQKEEEANARKFLLPFDNEFFLLRAKQELELLKLIRDPLSLFKELFFYDIEIPPEFARRFIALLPFSNDIKGNLELTAYYLSEVIGQKVSTKCYHKPKRKWSTSPINNSICKNSRLGNNLICGDHFLENVLTWEFIVLLDDETNLQYYIDTEYGVGRKLIETFYNYFVPVEVEVETHFTCTLQRQTILEYETKSVSRENQDIFLGFNTAI